MVAGKTALIPGSTSRIALGIVECFARKCVGTVLNGLGDAAEIETTRARLETKRPDAAKDSW